MPNKNQQLGSAWFTAEQVRSAISRVFGCETEEVVLPVEDSPRIDCAWFFQTYARSGEPGCDYSATVDVVTIAEILTGRRNGRFVFHGHNDPEFLVP